MPSHSPSPPIEDSEPRRRPSDASSLYTSASTASRPLPRVPGSRPLPAHPGANLGALHTGSTGSVRRPLPQPGAIQSTSSRAISNPIAANYVPLGSYAPPTDVNGRAYPLPPPGVLSERQAMKRPANDSSASQYWERKSSLDNIHHRTPLASTPSSSTVHSTETSSLFSSQDWTTSPSILTTPPASQQPFSRKSPKAYAYPPEKQNSNNLSPSLSFGSTNQFGLRRNLSAGTQTSRYTDDDSELHLNQALLSHLAVYLKDRVPRAEHTRGAIPFPMAFTGADIVSTITRALPDPYKSRRTALHIARSLHNQLFFFETRDNTRVLDDNLDQVYCFVDDDDMDLDRDRGHYHSREWEELPTGVYTEVTSCYSPLCARLTSQGIGGGGCLSPSCPNNINAVRGFALWLVAYLIVETGITEAASEYCERSAVYAASRARRCCLKAFSCMLTHIIGDIRMGRDRAKRASRDCRQSRN